MSAVQDEAARIRRELRSGYKPVTESLADTIDLMVVVIERLDALVAHYEAHLPEAVVVKPDAKSAAKKAAAN